MESCTWFQLIPIISRDIRWRVFPSNLASGSLWRTVVLKQLCSYQVYWQNVFRYLFTRDATTICATFRCLSASASIWWNKCGNMSYIAIYSCVPDLHLHRLGATFDSYISARTSPIHFIFERISRVGCLLLDLQVLFCWDQGPLQHESNMGPKWVLPMIG